MKFQILDTFEGFGVCNCNDASIKAIRGINFNETQRIVREGPNTFNLANDVVRFDALLVNFIH